MKNIFVAAAISGFVATGAFAQNSAFDNQDRASDAVDDLEELIEDDAERDVITFGTEGREIGSYGSVSLRATSSSDDDETATDLGIGLRYGTFDGVNGVDLTASLVYNQENGVVTENQALIGADYRRNFGDTYFGFAQADLYSDRLADAAGDTQTDVFVGAGVGYRIFNDADKQWTVQAGPGYRFIDVVDQEQVKEAAFGVSSNLYYGLNDLTFVTNDTDIITSDYSTAVTNDLALNVAVSELMVLRTSLTTVYDDAEDTSVSDASNTFGVSVVYNFN